VKLSTKGRYAVMALADLAAQDSPGPVTLADIADRQEISLSYLEQLFARLRRAGLVASVILAVDEPIRATRCTPGQPFGCRSNQTRCLTHDLWEELGNQIYLYLNSVTLDDVVKRRIQGTSSLIPHDDGASTAAAG
jgi:Rrf2 family iron-sulfur cluster assembly transcriptional regulator